jgi:hypothetical protein
MDAIPEPTDGDELPLLRDWLAYHRAALEAKCAGLTAEQLVATSVAPSDLSLLGLVRHLTEMERVYLVRPLRGGDLQLVYCTDDRPDGDIVGLDADLVAASWKRWYAERAEADALLDGVTDLAATSRGNRYSVRWNILKAIQEYAGHNGHAALIRERIDGARGD